METSPTAAARTWSTWALALALVVAPWIGRGTGHPLATGWIRLVDPESRPARLPDAAIHRALDAVVAGVDPSVPLALRWEAAPSADALAFVWVTASYRLAPRPVFPLLTDAEIESLRAADQLAPRLAAALDARADAVLLGDGIAVVWGSSTPCALPVPGLVAERREGPVCRLRAAEATP